MPNAIFIIGGDESLRSFHESLGRQLADSENMNCMCAVFKKEIILLR
jgi:hypothetical protein